MTNVWHININRGVPVALFLTFRLEFARFQGVKTKALQKTPVSNMSSLTGL